MARHCGVGVRRTRDGAALRLSHHHDARQPGRHGPFADHLRHRFLGVRRQAVHVGGSARDHRCDADSRPGVDSRPRARDLFADAARLSGLRDVRRDRLVPVQDPRGARAAFGRRIASGGAFGRLSGGRGALWRDAFRRRNGGHRGRLLLHRLSARLAGTAHLGPWLDCARARRVRNVAAGASFDRRATVRRGHGVAVLRAGHRRAGADAVSRDAAVYRDHRRARADLAQPEHDQAQRAGIAWQAVFRGELIHAARRHFAFAVPHAERWHSAFAVPHAARWHFAFAVPHAKCRIQSCAVGRCVVPLPHRARLMSPPPFLADETSGVAFFVFAYNIQRGESQCRKPG
ncbi:hypothetical protein BURKHO8Y_170283 [Burkholderia sp. 8Y]|nr:hypothetical protein BURKHO8Y_170283 [Burkholderia sp. 8Y]